MFISVLSCVKNEVWWERPRKGGCGWMWVFSSVQFSCSIICNSLQPYELQHARPPYPSPTPGVHPNSCPSSRWCHPAISSSVIPFSSCPQSLLASESFPMSQVFAWGGQSIGVSALASMSGSNCCCLTCVQISQEGGEVVWYSHPFKNFPQFLWSTQSKAFYRTYIMIFHS